MKQLNAYDCKSEEKLLERLDQAIFDVIDNPDKTQQTTYFGSYFVKRYICINNLL